MKRLLVFRHAKSSWRDATIDDHDRPLSARGERDAPKMARRIVAKGLGAALILTSTAKRASDTAAALAQAAGGNVTVSPSATVYLAGPELLLAAVAEQDPAFDTIVLVGHNPGLTQLVNRLLPDLELSNLPTAGVVAMRLPLTDWTRIAAATPALEYYDYPKRRSGQ